MASAAAFTDGASPQSGSGAAASTYHRGSIETSQALQNCENSRIWHPRSHTKESAGSIESNRRKSSRSSQVSTISTTSVASVDTFVRLHLKASKIRESFNAPSIAVHVGGTMLAICAGMVNAVSFLSLGTFVSHSTGNLSSLGMRLEGSAEGSPSEALLLIVSFMCGSLICGTLVSKSTVNFSMSMYGIALGGVSALLLLTWVMSSEDIAKYLASMACGLQNGIVTTYSGAVIRTTHVTGIATDIGLILGRSLMRLARRWLPACVAYCCTRSTQPQRASPTTPSTPQLKRSATSGGLDLVDLAELEVEIRKCVLLSMLGLGFLLGAVLGAAMQRKLSADAFLVPAAITAILGVIYGIFRTWIAYQAVHAATTTDDPENGIQIDKVSPKETLGQGCKLSANASLEDTE